LVYFPLMLPLVHLSSPVGVSSQIASSSVPLTYHSHSVTLSLLRTRIQKWRKSFRGLGKLPRRTGSTGESLSRLVSSSTLTHNIIHNINHPRSSYIYQPLPARSTVRTACKPPDARKKASTWFVCSPYPRRRRLIVDVDQHRERRRRPSRRDQRSSRCCE
jgi:hypothetical protein